MGDKEILILGSTAFGEKYSIHINIKDKLDLDAVIAALKPLGYTFRLPRGR